MRSLWQAKKEKILVKNNMKVKTSLKNNNMLKRENEITNLNFKSTECLNINVKSLNDDLMKCEKNKLTNFNNFSQAKKEYQ